MSDRITTTCQHTHTVTLRLDEGEWRGHNGRWIREARLATGKYAELLVPHWDDWWVPIGAWPAESEPRELRAELEAALAAAEASCGGCGCAERLREAGDVADRMSLSTDIHGNKWAGGPYRMAADLLDVQRRFTAPGVHDLDDVAAEFGVDLDAAPDARGSDPSAEDGEA